ncbi:MAG: VTT domain-containing protein [Treponema sp.]|jgi:uncharacterized membrane protein YdjX (TVP38/TMEM64 family)|nr:VTT domain-containing protein [Treponema sp.]
MKKENFRLVFFLCGFVFVTGIIALFAMYFLRDLQDPQYAQQFTDWVSELGITGVLVLFAIQVTQIVVAVIPGGPVQMIAGAAYGVWKGLIIMIIGCIFATIIIFVTVRRFGVPLVKYFFGAHVMEKWSFLSNSKRTAHAIFIFYLIPGLPKDFFVYLGPLTRLSLFHFTTISVFGRLPAMLSSTAMGDAAMRGNWALFLSVFAVTAVAGILGIQFREKLIKRFSAL